LAKKHSSRRSRRRSDGNRPRTHLDLASVEEQLQQVRSLFAVAALALDEVTDPAQLDEPAECDAMDVAVVIRLGIAQLNRARQALDEATP
jgi:hypothetical protein